MVGVYNMRLKVHIEEAHQVVGCVVDDIPGLCLAPTQKLAIADTEIDRDLVDDVIIFGFLNSVPHYSNLGENTSRFFLMIHFWAQRKAWWWYSKPVGWQGSLNGQICFNIMFLKSQSYKLVLSVFCIVGPPIHKWRSLNFHWNVWLY